MRAFGGKKSRPVAALAALIVAVGLSACSGGGAEVESTSESTSATSSSSPASTSASYGKTSGDPGTVNDTPVEAVPGDAAQQEPTTVAPHMGYTEFPDGPPTPIHKTIARCAKMSDRLYEPGTTWFTDGTSGWTQYCFDNFYDVPPPAYETAEPVPPADGTVYETSGEAQTAAGCEAGYIDPETCAYYGF